MNTIEVQITPSAVSRTEKILKRFIRAAKTRGYEDADYSISEPKKVTATRGQYGAWMSDGAAYHRMVVTVTIQMPDLSDDWEVVATLEPTLQGTGAHLSEAVVNMNPMVDEALFSTVPITFTDGCDHCQSGRRGRKKTMWIKHRESGDMRLVGSSCMFEYTAIDPKFIERIIEVKDMMRTHNCDTSGIRWQEEYEIASFAHLIAAWLGENHDYSKGLGSRLFGASVYCDGYIGYLGEPHAGHAGDRPLFHPMEPVSGITHENARHIEIHKFSGGKLDAADAYLLWECEFSSEVAERAGAFIEYLLALSGSNSFEHNARAIARSGVVRYGHANLIGGAVAGWLRTKKLTKTYEYADYHFGEVGGKFTDLQVEVTYARTISTRYGPSTLTRLRTAAGHQLIWWRSGAHRDLKQGVDIMLKSGSVKQHSEYEGTKQTTINYTKWELVE